MSKNYFSNYFLFELIPKLKDIQKDHHRTMEWQKLTQYHTHTLSLSFSIDSRGNDFNEMNVKWSVPVIWR